jgi:hypothetical protein
VNVYEDGEAVMIENDYGKVALDGDEAYELKRWLIDHSETEE